MTLPSRRLRPRRLILLVLASVALTVASAGVRRVGAVRTVEGEGFCPTPAPCRVAVLGAGLPLPYLVDDPQVSVPNSLHLVEDDLRPGAFLLDVLAWFAAGAAGLALAGRLGGARG